MATTTTAVSTIAVSTIAATTATSGERWSEGVESFEGLSACPPRLGDALGLEGRRPRN